MKPVFDITLRWYDDSSFLEDDPERQIELLLDSIGITSDVAVDIFHVLVVARAEDRALTARQIRDAVVNLREMQGLKNPEKGLTMRNIQVWLKNFKKIKLIDRIGGMYRFKGNKKPSKAFADETKPLIVESTKYVEKLLKEIEESYKIK